MSAPSSAYLSPASGSGSGRLEFTKGSTVHKQFIARFLMGTAAQGGYYDGGTRLTTSAAISAMKTAIKTLFHLDEILYICWGKDSSNHVGDAHGFIGMVIAGGTNAGYHKMSGSPASSLKIGHNVTYGSNTYIMLNDAGLNCRGDGNVSFLYVFANLAAGMASLQVPFYNTCKFTLQTKIGSGSWSTSSNPNMNGTTYLPVKASQTHLFSSSPGGSSSGTLSWQMICDNEEGQRTVSGSLTAKAAVVMFAAEYFNTGSTSNLGSHSEVYNGNTTNGIRVMLTMLKADYDAIITACNNYSWSNRGQQKTRVQMSLSLSDTYPSIGFRELYQRSSSSQNRYTDHQGYFMLTRDYGVVINTGGQITGCFYAYACPDVSYRHIRVVVKFSRTYDQTMQKYILEATVIAMDMEATEGEQDYDNEVTFTIQWASVYQATRTPKSTAYFVNGNTSNYGGVTVSRPSGRSAMATFLGYTTDSDVNGVVLTSVSVTHYVANHSIPSQVEYL